MMGVLAYVGLGSNLGDRRAVLESALAALAPRRVSSFKTTAPWGREDQPAFLNAVAEVETELAPRALLDVLLELERRHGRVRREHWGPRTLDLDLLLFGDRIVREPGLEIPHPRLAERRFVLDGLTELCPDLEVPGLGRRVRDLLRDLPVPGGVPAAAREERP
jgi:2-amino-4-hydroxy-6-hydroxymethyldihydropteridine diphosphokinase